jgi:hypothetical protein
MVKGWQGGEGVFPSSILLLVRHKCKEGIFRSFEILFVRGS